MRSTSIKNYIITILNGMSWGIMSSIVVGMVFKQIGVLSDRDMIIHMGSVASYMLGPAIGVGVAVAMKASNFAIMSSAVVGALGAGTITFVNGQLGIIPGESLGALIAAWAGVEASKLIAGKTKMDILLVPVATIAVGGLCAVLVSPPISAFMTGIGSVINAATQMHPIPLGIIVAMAMSMVSTSPISSAGIALSLGLEGISAGAATLGGSVAMVGFGVISFKANGLSGLIVQGLGTSKVQFPNVMRNPYIWLPTILTAAMLGPISSAVLGLNSTPAGAGMGSCGFVGQIAMLDHMGYSLKNFLMVLSMHFLLPAILTSFIAGILKRKKKFKDGDLKII